MCVLYRGIIGHGVSQFRSQLMKCSIPIFTHFRNPVDRQVMPFNLSRLLRTTKYEIQLQLRVVGLHVMMMIIIITRIAPPIAEDCYILAVFYLFSHHRFFDRHPWADFRETLPHDVVCPEIFYLLYVCTYVPHKTFEGRKPPFLPICGPKIDTFSIAIP